jgi:hypothetical protein
MIKEINSIADVQVFFENIFDEGTEIHPDDDFNNIVNLVTGEPKYSNGEVTERNLLMGKAFEICQEKSIDIYDLGLTVLLNKSGLNKFIPLPEAV